MSEALPDPGRARQLVAAATRTTVLSGAGLCTASGIPDFRGPQGLWTAEPDAERISTLDGYLNADAVVRDTAETTLPRLIGD